jgi:hypothetical protein
VKKFNGEFKTISVKDFFVDFKKVYKPSMINESDKGRKKTKPSFILIKKIIKTYLLIYFFDLYMNQKVLYFHFGGYLKKVQLTKKMKNVYSKDKTKLQYSNNGIGLFWFNKPNKKVHFFSRLIKLTGSTNELPKIEMIYRENYDIDLLPIFTSEYLNALEVKSLYVCTAT